MCKCARADGPYYIGPRPDLSFKAILLPPFSRAFRRYQDNGRDDTRPSLKLRWTDFVE